MKCLSLIQPWASLIAIGAKRVETRSWQTKLRGRIAIAASKRWPPEALDLITREPFKQYLKDLNLPVGKIICTVEIVDIKPVETLINISEHERCFGDYSIGRFGWSLANPRTLPSPIPVYGALGLYNLAPDILRQIDEQLP